PPVRHAPALLSSLHPTATTDHYTLSLHDALPICASVNMEVRSNSGNVYPVTYTMANIDGQWKVRNVIVEGINIGLLFRDQFAQAMQNHRNDLDAVIDNWGSVVAESREAVEKEVEE